MGKRILLINNGAMGQLFKPRGRGGGVLVRLAGPGLPDDVRSSGVGFVAEMNAFGIILESAAWHDLELPGQVKINGITALPDEQARAWIHLVIVNNPASVFPLCAIKGYDEPAQAEACDAREPSRPAETKL